MNIYSDELNDEDYAGIREYLKEKKFPLYKYVFMFGLNEKEFENYYPSNSIQIKKPKFYKIPEYPIGYTRTGEIICLPNFKITKCIGIFGTSGFGKGLLSHSIVDGIYHKFKYKGAIMNDSNLDTISWCGPMQTKDFTRKRHMLLEIERPLPVLHLVSKNIEIPYKTPSMKIKIPFDYFFENLWKFEELQNTKRYLSRIKIKDCNSFEEFENNLRGEFEKIKGTHFNAKNNMIEKILSAVSEYLKEGIISFDKNIHDRVHLNIDRSIEDPMVQIMKCDAIPVMVTQGLINNQEFFPEYFDYRVNQIFNYIDENKDFKENNKFFLLIDELNTILSVKKGRENVITTIKKLFREGRWRNISTIGVAQNITDIKEEGILSNMGIGFTFHCGDEDKNKFTKEFNLTKEQGRKISNLKLYEFIGKIREGDFIVYDNISNKKRKTNYVEGFLLPPLSHHLPPSSKNFKFSLGSTSGNVISTRGYSISMLRKKGVLIMDKEKKQQLFYSVGKEEKIFVPKTREPYLVQGVDYSKAFSIHGISVRDYDYFKNRGYYIIRNKKIYSITNNKSELMRNIVYYDKIPNDVFGIIFNPSERKIRLFGKNCSKEWISYE